MEALGLLRRRLRPSADFVADHVTELQGGHTSRETVRGDMRGRIRVDYQAPPELVNDVLLYGPSRFVNYHHARNTADFALWPTAWKQLEGHMVAAILKGRITARPGVTRLSWS
jgi:hypothetical protein